jgi:tetratricopeptide (TPR) repeat protein
MDLLKAFLLLILLLFANVSFAAENSDEYLNAGILKFNQKNYSNAIIDFDKAIPNNENPYESYYWRAESKIKNEDYDNALIDINKSIKLNPNFAKSYACRAGIYIDKEKLAEALTDANKAIELDSKLDSAYRNRALVFIEQKKYDLAIKDINTALALNPSFDNIYLLAYYRHATKDFVGVIVAADKILSKNIHEAGAYMIKLEAYNQLNDFKKVSETAKIAVKNNPTIEKNPSFLYYRTIACLNTGKPKLARKYIKKAKQ